eukprot:3184712-Prymnesium_polylepis.1
MHPERTILAARLPGGPCGAHIPVGGCGSAAVVATCRCARTRLQLHEASVAWVPHAYADAGLSLAATRSRVRIPGVTAAQHAHGAPVFCRSTSPTPPSARSFRPGGPPPCPLIVEPMLTLSTPLRRTLGATFSPVSLAASMDADARKLLELLGSAVERAEQVGVQQQALLLRQEESAEAFSTQIAEMTLEAEQERERLTEARNEFAALRAAEVARGREEADAIVAAARAEKATAHARIEELQQAQAQREAEHATQIALAQRERAEAEASYLERLRQREAEHEARVAQLQAQGLESVAERERSFEAACAER